MPLRDCPREAFHLFEGKVEQALVHFGVEDAPVSIGIVFDSSGSMRDKLTASRDAVARFLSLANPEDEFFLVDFNATAQVTVPFTGDAGEIQNQLLFTQPGGRTALLDAVTLAIDSMKTARNPAPGLADHLRLCLIEADRPQPQNMTTSPGCAA